MKLKLIILALIFLPSFTFADIIPTQSSYSGDEEIIINYDCFFEIDNPNNLNLYLSKPDGTELRGCETSGNVSYSLGYANSLPIGNYRAIMIPNNNTCNGFDECLTNYPIPFATFDIVEQYTIYTMVNGGQTAYSNTIGGSVQSDVSFVGDNFIKLFIGSGFAVLAGFVNWLIAILIIAIIVFFAYRAFRFFKT